jgi:hypothetical protein
MLKEYLARIKSGYCWKIYYQLSVTYISREPYTATLNQKTSCVVVVMAKHMQVSTLEGDRAYIVNYTAEIDKYNRFLPIVQDMVQSLKVFKDT